MRLVFIGCVQFSFSVLSRLLLLNMQGLDIVGVITKGHSPFNADFSSLAPLAQAEAIPCFLAEKNDQKEMVEWLRGLDPDVIYCFGWSHLLKKSILDIPTIGVIGYHPAALPQNRGRHPTIWALVLGLTQTASTFFFMDEGADSGDILSQQVVPIEFSDDASSLYQKLSDTACGQISVFTPKLMAGNYERIAQNHSKANYWRKRNKNDGEIDWRMSAESIYNLIRALTRPYIGAHFHSRNSDFKVWRSEVVDVACRFSNIEPGKVWDVSEEQIVVKCGSEFLRLVEHEFDMVVKPGDYL